MKERLSFTVDNGSVEILDNLLKKVKYRNRSHIIEVAIRALQEQEEGEKSMHEKVLLKKGAKR